MSTKPSIKPAEASETCMASNRGKATNFSDSGPDRKSFTILCLYGAQSNTLNIVCSHVFITWINLNELKRDYTSR